MWSMLPSRVLARTCSVILLIVLGHQLGGIIFGHIKIILIDFDHCSCLLFGAEREREERESNKRGGLLIDNDE